MKAQDFLRKGADLLEERGKQYDQPGGERSMGKAVSAFNTITGRSLSEAEGWLLLQILKDVRQWQNPDKYHADSAEDCVSYAALKAEALASGMDEYIDKFDDFGAPLPVEPAASIDDDSARMQAIGQNGNTGEHYDDAPSWEDAPEWANWLAQDETGAWYWYEREVCIYDDDCEWGEKPGADGRVCGALDSDIENQNWRNTLQARPTKEA